MIEELRNLGFSEKEAKIYILLSQEGGLSAPKIAKLLNLERRTVYDTLNSMFQKGKISRIKVQGTNTFSATSPEILKENFLKKISDFKKIIPELKKKKKADYPEINILFGINAIKTLANKALKQNGEALLAGRGGYLTEQLKESMHQFKPITKKIKWRMIQTKGYSDPLLNENGKTRFYPKNMKLGAAFAVFSDHLYLLSKHKEIYIIEIIDKDFADTFKNYFELMWSISKEK
jgi:sugar-specific transcriptional regulator TrmB